MPRIVFDISHYHKTSWYGIVTRELIHRILPVLLDRGYLIVLSSCEKISRENFPVTPALHFRESSHWYIRYKFFTLCRILRDEKADIFFSFDQELPLKKVCTSIIISHDIGAQILGVKYLLSHLFTGKGSRMDKMYHLLNFEGRSLDRADKIIVPSLTTRHDIARVYPRVSLQKLQVIPWGLDHLFLSAVAPLDRARDCILFPFSNLYSQEQYILARDLIEAGKTQKVVFLRPAMLPTTPVHPSITVITDRLSEQQKIAYYSQAQASVYLSDYDGFWFVPLESFVYGAPVHYVQSGSLQEIITPYTDQGCYTSIAHLRDQVIAWDLQYTFPPAVTLRSLYSWDVASRAALDVILA